MDDAETFQQQALELCPLDASFDPSAEPQNGNEYLMRMVYERRQCPSVVVRRPKNLITANSIAEVTATAATSNNKLTEPSCTLLLPTTEWKSAQTADFCAMRDRITALRRELDASRYDNTLEPPLTADAEAWRAFCREHPPRLSTILRLNQRTLEQLLEWLCEWMHGDIGSGEDDVEKAEEKETVQQVDLTCPTHHFIGSWLYAAFACLHLPLEPDVHSTLRDIARICLAQRGQLQPTQQEQAVPYNLFIHLIAHVFGQLDFGAFI